MPSGEVRRIGSSQRFALLIRHRPFMEECVMLRRLPVCFEPVATLTARRGGNGDLGRMNVAAMVGKAGLSNNVIP